MKSNHVTAIHETRTSRSRKEIQKPSLNKKPTTNSKSLAQMKREVWQESLHQCQNCRSQYSLEMDHRYPTAKGGRDSKDNLRILCRSCNQRAAIREFGQEKMDFYLN